MSFPLLSRKGWPKFHRVNLIFLGALAFGAGFLQPLVAQTTTIPQVYLETLVQGLTLPLGLQNAGDGSNRLFIAQQDGKILIYDLNQNELLPTPFLDISGLIHFAEDEGFLGLAFHPQYEVNGRFFVHYVDTDRNTVIARFTVSTDPNRANPTPDAILLTIPQRGAPHPHLGGQIQFGPDGFLYIAVGDGALEGDQMNYAQDLSDLHGKMLRLDVDNAEPYQIPAANPFVGIPGARAEIWALGLRNPWRFSFDRLTGEMFIADVGEERREEVNHQPANSPGGQNYGWQFMEGSLCFSPDSNCNDGTLSLPILEYNHAGEPCSGSIIGGYRYRGRQFPQMEGVYFYGDFCFSRVWGAVQQDDGSWTSKELLSDISSVTTFGEDEKGEVYLADFYEPSRLLHIAANNPVPTLASLSPSGIEPGSTFLSFALTVKGTGFVPTSVVRWNGSDRSTTFVSLTELRALIQPSDVAALGTAQVTVVSPAPGGGTSSESPFEIRVPPVVNTGGTVNGASFTPGAAVAAGSIASLFGSSFASSAIEADSLPLPTSLGGIRVQVNGVDAGLFYVSPTQINFQLPWEVAGQTQATVAVIANDVPGIPQTVQLIPSDPGIFRLDPQNTRQGAVQIAETGEVAAPIGSVPDRPARPVSRGEFLAIYCTGLGAVTNPPPNGGPALAEPLSETAVTPSVAIGGVQATVSFSGLAPGFVGLYQVNVQVPDSAPTGSDVELLLNLDGVSSNTVTIAVE